MRTRSLLAAPAAAVLLLGIVGGTALAQEETGRSCETVQSELAAAEADATLPVTIGGATLPNLAAVQSLYDSSKDVPALEATAAEAKAILDAVVRVELLQQETTTCVDDPGTTEPPADEDPPYESCAEAIEAGAIMPAVRGVNDSYQADLDADGDGVACEADEDTATPPTSGTGGGGSGSDSDSSAGGSGSGSFDFSQLDDVPSRAAETGGGPA